MMPASRAGNGTLDGVWEVGAGHAVGRGGIPVYDVLKVVEATGSEKMSVSVGSSRGDVESWRGL